MRVELLHHEDRTRWDRYVLDSGASCCYHLAGWKTVIERTFGHSCHYLVAGTDTGVVDGILPLVHIKSFLFGNYMVSLPYFNYGGICADTPATAELLLSEGIRIAREVGAEHLELRHTCLVGDDLPVKTAKVSMRLRLPGDPAQLWSCFSAKLKSQIRRPEKEGMVARVGGLEELEGFYAVFSENMRDLGTPVYPKSFFQNILAEFPEATRICTVRSRNGEAVASGFLVGFKDTLEIPWASSLRSANRFSPNMLLYWGALKYGCEQGYGVFDFGRSTPGAGTFRFKEQWGAQPMQLYWQYWLRDGGLVPELNPGNPKYQAAIAVWKRLPVRLTQVIGPRIVKNLP